MNEDHRDLLRKCRGDIIDAIATSGCLETLLDELGKTDQNGEYGLTQTEIIRIRGGRDTDAAQQARTFLDILPTRGENAFERFKQALIATNQIGQISILNSELPPSQQIIMQNTTLAVSRDATSIASNKTIQAVQQSLRDMYSKRFRYVHPISVPFSFDIEKKWVNLTLKLDDDSVSTDNYVDMLNIFNQTDMLITEGDPATGKTSLLRRLAYEWAQNKPQMAQYDFVLYAEFRKVYDQQFTSIMDLVIRFMYGYLNEKQCSQLVDTLADDEFCKQKQILVLLDGYDESSLKKQCQQLSDYLYSTDIGRPFWFKTIITSRKGYLSELRGQEGRFTFADILGFTTILQKEDYVRKHFTAKNGTQSTESINYVHNLLKTNHNLITLSDTPLLLTFICLVHKKIKEGSELELYMNIIWWLLDRHQRENPDRDVPGLLGFMCYTNGDKIRIIEKSYHLFSQLHLLGRMGMEDIFKSTFTEEDLEKFYINPIIEHVGLLRKEERRDNSFQIKTEFSFPHRTIQEFMIAFTFFFSAEQPLKYFEFYFHYPYKMIGLGTIQEKIQSFLSIISISNLPTVHTRRKMYSEIAERSINSHRRRTPKLNSDRLPESQNYVYFNCNKIDSIPKSFQEAVTILTKEADEGLADAQYSLAFIYGDGQLVEKNYNEIVKWYTKAADHGYAVAQYNLGVLYQTGEGVDQSYEEAVKWYTKAAEQGNAKAQFNLAVSCERGLGVDQSYEEAVKWYTKAAEQGDVDAQFNLAFSYQIGQGVDQSHVEAIKWYTKAAEQGDASAACNLEDMRKKQQEVDQTYEAVKWFIEPRSWCLVAQAGRLLPLSDEDVDRSYKKAVKRYTKEAEEGDADAQYNLGYSYQMGQGYDQSYEEAVRWYRKAAEQGHAEAQFNLALSYQIGQGADQSYEEAVKWYRKAAEQRLAQAQFNLGNMYDKGRGIEQSHEEAVKWYTKAEEQEKCNAKSNLAKLRDMVQRLELVCDKAVRGRTGPRSWYIETQGERPLPLTIKNEEDVDLSYKEAAKRYTKAAEEGDPDAQFNLAVCYENGAVDQSYEEAVKWYSKAAEQGHADAQFHLAVCYENGAVDQSFEEAVKWYTKAAEQGHADAQFNLALKYEKGEGVDQSNEEAIKWYTKVAEQGDADAQFNLALKYEKGEGVDQSYEEAVIWYTKAAEQGCALAQSALGFCYEQGQGVNRSYNVAVKWWRKAADQGDAQAQANLGEMYEKGKSVFQSYEEAEKWYNRAAEQGNLYGQICLWILNDKKQGVVPQSDEEAFLKYKKIAEDDNADAQYKLGFMYYGDRGVTRSLEESVKWYRRAAEQGNAEGQYNLAYMYHSGLGVPRSYDDAVIWFRKAAEQGNAFGQYYLGLMYENGLGVHQSYVEATFWYINAAKQGHAEAGRKV